MSAPPVPPNLAVKGRGGPLKTPIGGEDVCALVVEVGGNSVRVGFAQEDHPKIEASAVIGRRSLRPRPSTNGYEFCGQCCCCTVPSPSIASGSNTQQNKSDRNEDLTKSKDPTTSCKWTAASGRSASEFYDRRPRTWPPRGERCCDCRCEHPDLVFPIHSNDALRYTKVSRIVGGDPWSTEASSIAPETEQHEQKGEDPTRRQELHQHSDSGFDREGFCRAVKICVEGTVPGAGARSASSALDQTSSPQAAQHAENDCKCCCIKEGCGGFVDPQRAGSDFNGTLSTHREGTFDTSRSGTSTAGICDVFGCSPFGGLGVWTSEHPVLVVEPTSHNSALRRQVAAALFEDLKVPAAYFAKSATLAAFAMGRSSALVVELGGMSTTVSAVYEGFSLRKTTKEYPLGGEFLDKQIEHVVMRQLHQKQEQNPRVRKLLQFSQEHSRLIFPSFLRREMNPIEDDLFECFHPSLLHYSTSMLIKDIRQCCCVVRPYEDASQPLLDTSGAVTANADDGECPFTSYELPDGTQIDTTGLRYTIGEMYFQPKVAMQALRKVQPEACSQAVEDQLKGFDGLPQVSAEVHATHLPCRRLSCPPVEVRLGSVVYEARCC